MPRSGRAHETAEGVDTLGTEPKEFRMTTYQIIYLVLLTPISLVCLCSLGLGVLVLVAALRDK